ncbi:MAG TPA: hypothetical protein VLI90_16040, partial [Tepidisphaeraceae bacterium]|nr:hypothetical protein [Tepidisphaeraceae bacterium]
MPATAVERLECRMMLTGDFGFVLNRGAEFADSASAVASDSKGDVFITGSFEGTVDFDPFGPKATHASLSTDSEGLFAAKYDRDSHLLWVVKIYDNDGVRTSGPVARDIAVDTAGNAIVTYIVTSGPPVSNATIVKISPSGLTLWSRTIIGANVVGVATTPSNEIVTLGTLGAGATDVDPGAGTFTLTPPDGEDAFVEKLGPG